MYCIRLKTSLSNLHFMYSFYTIIVNAATCNTEDSNLLQNKLLHMNFQKADNIMGNAVLMTRGGVH